MKRETNKIRFGFTLVELLTTMAVVAILLGLLIPALNQVTKTAAKVKQKAQFHAIGMALESFRNDYGDYPPSEWNAAQYGNYSASHRLAEALIGRDGLGYHPGSLWRSDGLADIDKDGTPTDVIYGDPAAFTAETPTENLAARKGPYLELENANAVELRKIIPGSPLYKDAYVLVDMYKIIKNSATGKMTGMPILYYKANTMKIGNDPVYANWGTNTYNIGDSFCQALGFTENFWATRPVLFSSDTTANATTFYNAIQNPNFPGPPARPYRADSFLLQSAGADGLYGTADDVFNFDQDN